MGAALDQPHVEIRAYCVQELDRVMRVWRAATVIGHPFLSEADLDRDEALIRGQYMSETETWGAWSASELVGFISLLGNRVVALFVEPARHRQGIGGRLLAHAKALHGPLTVEVFASNQMAVRFYRRHAFAYLRDEPTSMFPDQKQWLMAQPGAKDT